MLIDGILSKLMKVRISDCVHFAGFRYGVGAVNPYENYIVGLSRGRPASELRSEFVDFLRFYRPTHLGEALDVNLSKKVPLWALPWRRRRVTADEGWKTTIAELPDIITYYCELGVPLWRVKEEFFWLERAWRSVAERGYRPREFDFVTVFELIGGKESRFLVLDGNHRISALAALGVEVVEVRRAYWNKARRESAVSWPAVKDGRVTVGDALLVFDAYFCEERQISKALRPARLLTRTQCGLFAVATEADLENLKSVQVI